jgi:hypothetical protein
MVWKLKLVLYPSLVLAVFLVGLCRASWGQGDTDLEAHPVAWCPGSQRDHPLSPFLAQKNNYNSTFSEILSAALSSVSR